MAQLRSLGEALGSGGGPACSDRLLITQQAVGACCGAEAARLRILYAFRKGLG